MCRLSLSLNTYTNMLSMPILPSIEAKLTSRPSYAFMKVCCLHPKPSFSVQRKAASLPNMKLKIESTKRIPRLPRAAELAPAETLDGVSDTELGEESQVGKEVKSMAMAKAKAKPRLVLKFIWMEKNIGLGLDQMIGGHGSVPLSPYFFWPRKDAWEELKTVLESKPWISQKKMIILLNQATDIINLWQQSGANLS